MKYIGRAPSQISEDPQDPNKVLAGPSSGTARGIPSFRALESADLPAPNGTNRGAVYIGEGLISDTDGRLSLSLTAENIPNLDANKLTSGTLDPSRLSGKSVTRSALANNSISYIQETDPGIVTDHIGCLWLQESTGQLRMWNGNNWSDIGFGILTQENLRWGGIINASTNQLITITQIGVSAGLTVGNPLPAATDTLSGIYVVVGVPGSAVDVTPGIAYDNGDFILCIDNAQGWTNIDTLSGGGGGATILSDLLDVATTSPTNGQVLQYDSALGEWVNSSLTPVSVTSVFGRSGAISAANGDYTLNQLGDVDVVTFPPSTGDVLQFNGSTWEPGTLSSLSDPTTTQGDLIQRGATNIQRLAIGTANQVLTVNAAGTLAEWRTIAVATTANSGVTRLATLAETTNGTLSTAAVTPASLKATYMPLDISTLLTLP